MQARVAQEESRAEQRLLLNRTPNCCRANVAHARQSGPESGLGFHIKGVKTIRVVPSSFGRGKLKFIRNAGPCGTNGVPDATASSRRFRCLPPLSSELGTYKTVKTRFWSWSACFPRFRCPPTTTAEREGNNLTALQTSA